MKFKIEIDLDSAAFGINPGEEIITLLEVVRLMLEQYPVTHLHDKTLIDINGNISGKVTVTGRNIHKNSVEA